MSVLHRNRREGLLGSRGLRQSTLLSREYRGQGNGDVDDDDLNHPSLSLRVRPSSV